MVKNRTNSLPIMAIAAMIMIVVGFVGVARAQAQCPPIPEVQVSEPTVVFTQSCFENSGLGGVDVSVKLVLPAGQTALDHDVLVVINKNGDPLISMITISAGKTTGTNMALARPNEIVKIGSVINEPSFAIAAADAGGQALIIAPGMWPTPGTGGNCGGSSPYPAPNAADKQCKVFLPDVKPPVMP